MWFFELGILDRVFWQISMFQKLSVAFVYGLSGTVNPITSDFSKGLSPRANKQRSQKVLETLIFWKFVKTLYLHNGTENLKKSRPKKLVKSINFTKKKIMTNFHILQFQKWPKINFWTGKKFKIEKMQFHVKIFFWFIWFDEFFFAWTFFNFLAHCAML